MMLDGRRLPTINTAMLGGLNERVSALEDRGGNGGGITSEQREALRMALERG